MIESDEERIVANLAKAMAMICVRNTRLEDLHAGPVPVSRTGDYSDVFVLEAEGNRIPWTEVSRLEDDEMRDLMRQIVNRLYVSPAARRSRLPKRDRPMAECHEAMGRSGTGSRPDGQGQHSPSVTLSPSTWSICGSRLLP